MTNPDSDPRFAHVRHVGGHVYAAFLAAGYREYYQSSGFRSTPYLLQKCIRGPKRNKLYYINIWAYDHTKYVGACHHPFGLAAECQFNTRTDLTFNVELNNARDVAKTEEFFKAVYMRMGCEPYEDDE